MDLDQFGQSWKQYLGRLAACGSHMAIEVEFLKFIEEAFGIRLSSEEYQFEKRVYKGRIDALLGNLVIEFKKNLIKEKEDAKLELEKYFQDLTAKHPVSIFTGVATDGVWFQVYDQNLKPLSDMRDLRRAKPDEVLSFLDSLLFIFRSLQTPTTSNIVASFGPRSPTFLASQQNMARLFALVRGEPAVQVRFQSWKKYLQRVYGEDIGDETLFLKHTYLSTLAKFIAFFFRFGAKLPGPQDIEEVVNGAKFSREGISNFIEDDFFTWVLHEKIKPNGLNLVQKLVASLMAYDFSAAKQDILKELYEEILGQEARHNLGEYYTPDWLAEYMLSEMVKLTEHPDWRVLDPACGSGTFLFIAIRLLQTTLGELGVPGDEILRKVLYQVVGIDVHPVAVTIARTNYLLALGDLLKKLPERISLPVYLADSLRLPKEVQVLRGNGETIYQVEAEKNVFFSIPASVGSHLDEVVETMREFIRQPAAGSAHAGFQKRIEKFAFSAEVQQALLNNMDTLLKLYAEGKDTVWLFILKNMPRPHFLRQEFDLVVGNPPWLSLRYITDAQYAKEVKQLVLKTYRILGAKKAHLFTHIDLAPLFFVQASFLYLKKGGHIAFVMPRGVLSADQYADFTSFEFIGEEQAIWFKLEQVVDLAPVPKEREVTPLFRQAACVLFAEKGADTKWPVLATEIAGKLSSKNLRWAEAQQQLKLTKAKLSRVGGRLLADGDANRPQGKSYYYNMVFEGATLVPRNLFFVRSAPQPGPLNKPNLVTDEDEARHAKSPWRDIRMRGVVEAQFIFATLLGGDILPFGHAPLRPVVLPVEVQSGKPVMLNYNTAIEQGYTALADWLRTVEAKWQEHAKKDEGGETKFATILDRLDYHNLLSRQNVNAGYKILYNAAGTHIASTILDLAELGTLNMGSGMELLPYGFIADSKTYYFESDNHEDANYLGAVLNSAVLNLAIKPLQSRGLWGERDIVKKPFLFPIPQYNPKLSSHRKLAEIGQQCEEKVAKLLPQLLPKYKGSGPLRTEIRKLLAEELKTIDWHVKRILKVGSPFEGEGQRSGQQSGN